MVLAAMLDKVTRAYDLESKHPAIKYVGHEEVVRGIDYLPEKGLYITGELLFHSLTTHLSSSKAWVDRFLGRGFMHSANS